MNVLITGIAGCGKSTVAKKLQELGYVSYDIESIRGLFAMRDKETKELVKNFDDESIESTKQNEWICDIGKLKDFIQKDADKKVSFYCGMASNFDELLPLFDIKLLLVADEETTLKRLRTRKGPYEYGHTHEVQQDIISWKPDWEKKQLEKGLIKIDASEPLGEVVKSILEKSLLQINY